MFGNARHAYLCATRKKSGGFDDIDESCKLHKSFLEEL